MKRIFFLVILVAMLPLCAESQFMITPPELTVLDTSGVIHKNITSFILGWNWGCPGRGLDSILNINFYHNLNLTVNGYGRFADVAQAPVDTLITGRARKNIFNGQAIQLEPTITVDSTENFTPRTGDTTGAVFGFGYRNMALGYLNSTPGTANFCSFLIDSSAYTGSDSVLILNKIWKGDILKYLDYSTSNYVNPDDPNDSADINGHVYEPYNGKRLYITVNLRAMDSLQLERHLNDTLLIVKLKYWRAHEYIDSNKTKYIIDSGYVKFDSIPSESTLLNAHIDGGISSAPQYRGNYRRLVPTMIGSKPTEFAITGNMLRILSAFFTPYYTQKYIALSAFAIFNNSTDFNPILKYDYVNQFGINDYITKFDVEVYYKGNVNLAIDYVRLETPRTQDIVRGVYDELTRVEMDSIVHRIRAHPDSLQLCRIYTMDELTPQYWFVERYFNYLVDTLASLELSNTDNPPKQYHYSTGINEFWNGNTIWFRSRTAAPYIMKPDIVTGNDRWNFNETNNYTYGYAGNYGTVFDSLRSEYETFLTGRASADLTMPLEDSTAHDHTIYDDPYHIDDNNVQYSIEDQLYHYYYKNPQMVFSTKPWWGNIWSVSGTWHYDPNDSILYLEPDGSRPRTGEELRVITGETIAMGAKGLIYWIKSGNDRFIVDQDTISKSPLRVDRIYTTGFQASTDTAFANSLPSGDSLIYSDAAGSDFIMQSNDPLFGDNFNPSAFNWSHLGTPSTRMYIGRKSLRSEINKLHKFIKANEETLFDLKPVAWWGKGFSGLYMQDAEFDSTSAHVLDNFIDFHNIKTRPIDRIDGSGYPYYEQASGIDSGFYDITLHRDITNDTTMLDTFYIAVVNRRTDPLVRPFDTLTGGVIDSSMKFYSTAEFDINTQSGGNTIAGQHEDSLYWRDLYFKRQGCREITIPFDYINTSDTNEYALLRITELKDSSAYNSSWWWWRKEKWNRAVDTVIGQDNKLALKFLPGEMRWFKVTVLHPQKDVAGILANSNQHKLTVMPYVYPSGVESTDSVRYHLVYHRSVATPLPHYEVFYRRSDPISRKSSNTNIKWGNEISLSKFMAPMEHCIPHPTVDSNYNAMYPSIAVRKEGNEQFAYVVFQAFELFSRVDGNDSCKYWSGSCNYKHPIYEIRFNVSSEPLSPPVIFAKPISYVVNGSVDCANPTINAGTTGNYIAWSDSLCGLKVVYQAPGVTLTMLDTLNVKGDFGTMSVSDIIVENPSVNPYSDSNYVSVVWQQRKKYVMGDTLNPNQICYSRFKYESGNLASTPFGQLFDSQITYPIDTVNNVICVTDLNSYNNSYPTILSELVPSSPTSSFFVDRIFYNNIFNGYFSLLGQNFYTTISCIFNPRFLISTYSNKYRILRQRQIITGSFTTLPVSQPITYLVNTNATWGGSLIYNEGENILSNSPILNFVRAKSTSITQPTFKFVTESGTVSTDIINVAMESGLKFDDNGWLYPGNPGLAQVGHGVQPHLSTSELEFTYSFDTWKNRRVQNLYSSAQSIYVNSKYFLKNSLNDIQSGKYVGFESDTNFYVFGAPNLDGNTISYRLPYDFVTDSIFGDDYYPNGKDTLYTDWFTVNSLVTLKYEAVRDCADTNLVRTAIQKRSDGSLYPIPLAALTNILHRSLVCKLVNGSGEDYRFVIYKPDTNHGEYAEKVFMDLDTSGVDTLTFKGSTNQDYIIDLGNKEHTNVTDNIDLTVFPNPANDVIFVRADLPASIFLNSPDSRVKSKVSYKIYNSLGTELAGYTGNSGETIEIPTTGYSGGVYFIRAEIESNYYNKYDAAPAIQMIVIKR